MGTSVSKQDGQGIAGNNFSLTGRFTKACSFAENVEIVRIPSDFIASGDAAANYSGLITVGHITPESSRLFVDFLQKENTNSINSPDFFRISSLGGDVVAIKNVTDIMDKRSEIAHIQRADSAATALVSHIDKGNAYATEDGTMLFHEARVSPESLHNLLGRDADGVLKDLEKFTGKTTGFLAGDFGKLANIAIANLGPDTHYSKFLQDMEDVLHSDNTNLINAYKKAGPGISDNAGCAESLVTADDLRYNAEESLKMGFIDAVLQGDGTMFVRHSDPRAEKMRNENPSEYDRLNTPISDEASSQAVEHAPKETEQYPHM